MPIVTITVPDIAIGRAMVVDVEGVSVLLCRTASGLHASAAACPHQGKPMDDARVRGTSVLCPWHGASFDLTTGASRSPQLTDRPLTIFHCIDRGGQATIEMV